MVKPGDAAWHSPVQTPLDAAEVASWDEERDVVVVGFGGAGVVAALQARLDGADVLALDRFGGGGATAISGGVVYAGGTPYQAENGYPDDAEQMFRYLRLETRGVVADATLRRFCEDSAPNLAWLEAHGVPFEGSLCPVKTSYPTNEHYLYFSGNEAIDTYAAHARPAPRGHRAKGRGLPGAALYDPLRASAERHGVRVLRRARVLRLVVHDERVVGCEARVIPAGAWAWVHDRAWRLGLAARHVAPGLARRLVALCERLEARHAVPRRIRARRGVVIAAGGFVFNRALVREVAPAYRGGMPLGTAGCDGSGIRLGQSVGGQVDHLDRVSAWRFINPPLAWAQGVFVDGAGRRFCNEAVYGAKLGRLMVEEHGGVGWLVVDAALRRQAFAQLGPGKAQWFQQAPGILSMLTNSVSAPTIEALAARVGLPPDALARTVSDYNAAIAAARPDPLGKPDAFRRPVVEPPFYAMDCGVRSKRFPCPTLTLGGLVVDERTGGVRGPDGAVIPGLFAAGRAAVGVSSCEYVSGLSLADCVFSGRRAGRAAAGAEISLR